MAREGVSRIPDLERLLPFHHKEWIFQRLGWAVMSLFLAAAAAGLLGPGGLSRASAGDSRARLAYANALRSQRDDALFELQGRDLRQQIADTAAIEERDEHGMPRLRG